MSAVGCLYADLLPDFEDMYEFTCSTCYTNISNYNKIATHSHMYPATIERDVMQVCDIFISVKVSLLLHFQN